jgi:two-component system, LuxR family, sensor kinase FixL
MSNKDLFILARREARCVAVDFIDNGGVVKHPELLFHPFQDGAHANGLDLDLYRAFMRSFGGELRYKPVPCGACFTVELSPMNALEGTHKKTHGDLQSVTTRDRTTSVAIVN